MKTLQVSVPRQEAYLIEENQITWSFPISTSRFGLGPEEGSNRTPLGQFRICEKYGGRSALGTIFQGRKATGVWTPDEKTDADLVLTRILRLESTEKGLENTYSRYIYFHGTNQESLLGSPSSHGCIRVSNENAVKLYSLVSVGTFVNIFNENSTIS